MSVWIEVGWERLLCLRAPKHDPRHKTPERDRHVGQRSLPFAWRVSAMNSSGSRCGSRSLRSITE
ncbi:hypothetical protein [Accumulibacter sp.]|uniref:hypothetical protein n=1 Tax=Accumulibacter sp. TaxID=2053492 RepID=UPI0026001289|nr:hypothetical protein [Accumulibacter sp.]MCM8613203.1 hypothetical protein [Accumulibacter sp.]MCM8636510.1 hypothetical protein [Accumulibacter sp.]MCM8640256.1 hypothetical protein [Accumulibacter sp.]